MRIPSQEHYSTRCTMSHRPPFRTGEPIFFRCSHCGNVIVVCPAPKGTWEIPVLRCCDTELKPLQICRDPEVIRTHGLDFVVFGGFEHNAIRITVDGGLHPMDEGHRIEWVYLKTYQGGQLKLLPPGIRAVVHFSLADEDAYVYCDRAVCRMGREHCQFACKRGMTVYAYCSKHGLMARTLTEKRRDMDDG